MRAVRRLTPATEILPLVAGKRPQSMRNVVVLPAPFGPSRPKTSPRRTENEVCETAVKSPNLRTRSCTSISTGAATLERSEKVPICPDEAAAVCTAGPPCSCTSSLRSVMKPSSRRGSMASAVNDKRARGLSSTGLLRVMKRTTPPDGTASITLFSASRRLCSERRGIPSGGVTL